MGRANYGCFLDSSFVRVIDSEPNVALDLAFIEQQGQGGLIPAQSLLRVRSGHPEPHPFTSAIKG